MTRPLPIADLSDFLSGDEARIESFIQTVGDSLADIGFFALTNHGIDLSLIEDTYREAESFFMLNESEKRLYSKLKSLTNVATLHLESSMPKTILLLI
ncbi:MAG: 2-oxoglutarate and iron-dependent oxygenase domain-containing protein [Candidatus Poseidoniaceae archaeon]